jgi:VanZ family protein
VTARTAALAARIATGLGVCSVVLLLMMPSSVLKYLRHNYLWLGRFVDWLELFSSRGMNLTHVFAFFVLGVLARIALPRWPVRNVLAWTVVIGVATECAQIWIPGRTPRFWDIVGNTLGVLLGLGLGSLFYVRSGVR